ncbi:MAG: PEGA domain-containing protein [Candidatus Buchananbacteria bacterium]
MTLLQKRFIYSGFFLLFAISTPLLIFYTAGYSYNTKRGALQNTGLIMVEAKPKSLNILLNNILVAQQTPARIKDLTPGKYLLTLAKDNYYPWEKNITITADQANFIQNITLIKKNIPQQLFEAEESNIKPLFNANKILYLAKAKTAPELIIYDLTNNQTQKIYTFKTGEKIELLAVAPSENKILLKNSLNNYSIFNLSTNEIFNLTTLIGKTSTIKWHLSDDNIVYFTNSQGLWQADLFNGKKILVESVTNLSDFWLTEKQKITIFKVNDRNLFKYQDLLTNWQQVGTIKNNLKIWGVWQNKIIFKDPINQEVLVADIFSTEKQQRLMAKNLIWWDDHTLLTYTDWEISFYSLTEEKSYLINRYGEKIQALTTLDQNRRLVLVLNNNLQLMELADTERLNNLDLLKTEKISNLSVDLTGKNLFFSAQIGQQSGYYLLNLLD